MKREKKLEEKTKQGKGKKKKPRENEWDLVVSEQGERRHMGKR